MLPRDLKPEQFSSYPPEARKLAVNNLATLQQLPLSFLPSLLRELIEYDYKFPVEAQEISREIAQLGALSPAQMQEWFRSFRELSLSKKFEEFNWLNQPAQFLEQLSAYLWSTHQLDKFRKAAMEYGDRMRATVTPGQSPASRLGIAIIGQGLSSYDGLLFRNLREHGTYFSHINPENGVQQLLKAVATRAQAYSLPYGHWYVEGGQTIEHSPMLTCVSYQALEPVRLALLSNMQAEIKRPGMGPEELRTNLAALQPAACRSRQAGRCCTEPLSVEAADRRLRHTDIQHDVCAMDSAGGVTSCTAAHAACAIRTPSTRALNERTAVQHRRSLGAGLEGIVDRCRHGSVLQLDQSTKIAGS